MQSPITPLGIARHQYGDRPFGIRLADRMHHLYLIGQTGTGKSTFLLNLALHDARAGRGLLRRQRFLQLDGRDQRLLNQEVADANAFGTGHGGAATNSRSRV